MLLACHHVDTSGITEMSWRFAIAVTWTQKVVVLEIDLW